MDEEGWVRWEYWRSERGKELDGEWMREMGVVDSERWKGIDGGKMGVMGSKRGRVIDEERMGEMRVVEKCKREGNGWRRDGRDEGGIGKEEGEGIGTWGKGSGVGK